MMTEFEDQVAQNAEELPYGMSPAEIRYITFAYVFFGAIHYTDENRDASIREYLAEIEG